MNGLKTLSMRIRGYDEETEEYSEDVAELTGTIADLTKTASNTRGVSLFEEGDPDTYRSTYDILKDISEIYDEITDKNQAKLLEALFGKRQSQIGAAILSNFEQAEASIQTMAESAGSADQEMEKIYNSLDYKLNALKETWVGVAQNLFQTDQIGDVIEFLTKLSDAVDGITESFGLFGTAGLVVAGVSIAKFISGIRSSYQVLSMAMNSVSGAIATGNIPTTVAYATALSGLDAAQQKALLSQSSLTESERDYVATLASAIAASKAFTVADFEKAVSIEAGTISTGLNISATSYMTEEIIKSAIANGKLTKAQLEAIVTTDAQTAANRKQALSFEALGATAKASFAAMLTNPMTWISVALMLLPGLIKLYDKLANKNKELIEQADEIKSSYDSAASELSNEISTIKDLSAEYKELSDGVDAYGNNISLAADDYKRYKEIVNTILGLSPSLIEGYDAEGNAIANKNGLIERSIELLEEERRLRMEELVSDDNLTTLGLGRAAEINEYRDNNPLPYDNAKYDFMKAFEAATERYVSEAQGNYQGQIYNILNPDNLDLNNFWQEGYWSEFGEDAGRFAQNYYETIVASLRENRSILENYFTQDEIDSLLKIAEQYDDNIDAYNKEIERLSKGLNPTLQIVPQVVTAYSDLDGAHKSFLSDYINNIRLTGFETEEDIKRIKEDILALTNLVVDNEDLQGVITFGVQLSNGVDQNGKPLTVSEYNALIQDLVAKIGEFDEEVQIKLRTVFGIDAETGTRSSNIEEAIEHLKGILKDEFERESLATLTVEEVLLLYNLTAAPDSLTPEDIAKYLNAVRTENIESLTTTLTRLSDAYSMAESAQDEFRENGTLSIDTINKLAEANEDYLDFLEVENGHIKLNTKAWVENAKAKTLSNIAERESIVADLRAEKKVLEEQADLILQQYRDFESSYGISNTSLLYEYENVKDQINDLDGEIAEHEKNIGILNAAMNDAEASIASVSNVLADLNAKGEQASALISSLQTLNSGTVLTTQELYELAQQYPKLLEAANLFTDGTIEGQKAMLEAVLGTYESEYDALVDAEIAKIELKNSVLEQQLALENERLGIVKDIAEQEINNKLDAEEQYREKLNKLRDLEGQDYVEYAQGILKIHEQMLEGQLQQEADAQSKSSPSDTQSNLALKASVAKGKFNAVALSDGNVVYGSTKNNPINITIDGQSVDDWASAYGSAIEDRITLITDQINRNDALIKNLEALKGLDLKSIYGDSSSGSGSAVDAYIADIDDYREAVERLNEAQRNRERIETEIDYTDDIKQRIALEKQLLYAYETEQDALEELNRLRDGTIKNGVEALKQLGFLVDYDAETNKLYIRNMEHLNELTADSVGNYGSMQEATNALREDTEELINTLTDLNEENRDSDDTWRELANSIRETNINIINDLKEIVTEVSDAVDSIQDVYETLHSAADEYAQSGFITVDTLQSLIEMGVEYMSYLRDENGQLVINEERIRAVIAAKTEQLAIESALSYVESLKLAQQTNDIALLNSLLYATQSATNATWGLVYANLALVGLSDDQYYAALSNINAIRAMAENAVMSIGQTTGSVTDELENMQDGLNDILDYVMDMLKDRIDEQVDGLEEMKDAYSDIIELQKKSLEKKNEEVNRQKTQTAKLKEIAKLQARIDALSLDNSREAQSERAALLEEMAGLQSDLEDTQADYAVDVQTEALDKMEEAYHQEKDEEIKILEDSISSTQKLYDMAISYIESNWSTLKDELIRWNYEVGNSLESELVSAWNAAYAAAQRYGSFTAALNHIGADIEASQNSGGNLIIGNTNYGNGSSNEENIHAIIREMYANSQSWPSANEEGRKKLDARNLELGAMLARFGVNAYRKNGVWYVDGGEELYEKYRKYCYHDGGVVGGSIKDNEQLSLLKDNEWVLSEEMVKNLKLQMERISALNESMNAMPAYVGRSIMMSGLKLDGGSTVNNVTNNSSSQPMTITFGDTIIHGADGSSVKQHITVSRDMVNQIAKILKDKM